MTQQPLMMQTLPFAQGAFPPMLGVPGLSNDGLNQALVSL